MANYYNCRGYFGILTEARHDNFCPTLSKSEFVLTLPLEVLFFLCLDVLTSVYPKVQHATGKDVDVIILDLRSYREPHDNEDARVPVKQQGVPDKFSCIPGNGFDTAICD